MKSKYNYSEEIEINPISVKCGMAYYRNEKNVLSVAFEHKGKFYLKRADVTPEVESVKNANIIIKGVSELLNMRPSGSNEDFCDSFYKNENGLKFRVSNHQTTQRWADVFGYADINIIIFNGKAVSEVEKELREVNLTIEDCVKAGNKAFEIIEHNRRMRMFS